MDQKAAFPYRGFMLDSARHFMPVESVLRILEGAARCGMNHMHWHLTDDQGWRVEIRRFPRLTEVGSHRGEDCFGEDNEQENNHGFYTQEDIRRVVAFAREQGVEIIPEIEVPGHASAMLAAYPEYGCRREIAEKGGITLEETPYEYQVGTLAGIFPNLICAGREESFQFLTGILDEIAELFPGPMVHIGGDEAIKMHWRRCPDCQRRMRALGLHNEHELQRELVLRVGEYLRGKGKRTIVWNESLDGGLLPDHFIVQHWLGNDRETAEFMAAGGKVICSDLPNYYISQPYCNLDVRTVWQAPAVPEYAREHPENLLGLECPLWTEHITNPKRAEYMLFPRLAAVALKASQPSDAPTWEEFLAGVRALEEKVEALGIAGAPEDTWALTPERAEAERAAFTAQRHQSKLEDTWRICDNLVMQERMEKLLLDIGMPRPFALRVMDAGMAGVPEFAGRLPEPEGDGADVMASQLVTALKNRQDGPWTGLPEEIFLDTMRAYTRFVGEHMRSTGRYAFDRGFWTTRQADALLFRVGALEYELLERDEKPVLSLHIPSDIRLVPEALNASVAAARRFMAEYRPAWKDAPMVCASWLMFPGLKDLLPEDSHILRFQRAFDFTGVVAEEGGVLEWVFNLTAPQQEHADLSALPEDTSLRRRMKAFLLAGGKVGVGRGVLAREFA